MAIPLKDSLLAAWSTNANTRIVASPGIFGLSALQASSYTAVHTPFINAYNAICAPGAKSSALVAIKDAAKKTLLDYARQIYGFVQANNTVSDADKLLLGVTVRALPTPAPIPATAPSLDIVKVDGNDVLVRLHDAAGDGKRTKPVGVKSASIWTHVGATAPTDPAEYTWQGSTGKTLFSVNFPASVVPGTKVWICAMWVNSTQQPGPTCAPVGTVIQYNGGMSMAA